MKNKIQSLYSIYDIENLWDIICRLDKGNANIYKKKIKKKVLKVLQKMLAQNVIYLGDQWVEKSYLKKWELSNEKIIEKIDEKWSKNIEFQDLYTLVWIGYEDWYIEKLKKLGMTHTTNWKSFVNEEIGDLKEWIEENKPK